MNSLDNKGMSLVEVMVALVILLFVSLAMMQTALVSIESNMRNVLRDEAVSIAEMRMNDAKSGHDPFVNPPTGINITYVEGTDLLLSDAVAIPDLTVCPASFAINPINSMGVTVQRNLRNVTNFNFCTNRTISPNTVAPSPVTKQIIITVGWKWKGVDYTHRLDTIVRRQ